jgi:tetratricopeptide (TPR) repeat protein
MKKPVFLLSNKRNMQMKSFRWIIFILLAFFLSNCNPAAKLTRTQQAQQAFEQGKLQESLQFYEELIAADEASSSVAEKNHYEQAAEIAEALGLSDKAESYYKLAIYHKIASPEVYQKLGKLYREQGNISKESGVLEPLEQLFPQSEEANEERTRLFEIYTETAQWEKAIDLWPPNPQAEQDEHLLTAYFSAKQKSEQPEGLDKIALQLLSLNPNHTEARSWQAIQLYDKAEARYQKEVQDYENNKTRKQYNIMLEGLDASTADFKRALPLFENLYSETRNKRFALYIANIYARFGDATNAEKYRKLSQ